VARKNMRFARLETASHVQMPFLTHNRPSTHLLKLTCYSLLMSVL